MVAEASVAAEKPVGSRPSPSKKNQVKVPKKIHKSEREKLKRDQINELFLELGSTLEPNRQNNGKASILNDATKILRTLLVQVESLRKENAVLIAETQYVRVEKNELKDETKALSTEVQKLHEELIERMQFNPSPENSENYATSSLPQLDSTGVAIMQAASAHEVGPDHILPSLPNLQHHPEFETELIAPPSPKVRRPQPRYPTPDSWPFQLLSQQQTATTCGAQETGT